ncbi:hypothetical protein [Cucumibacter marinus]|uniref:hypothetical protein n=1 Tax=Cucumibacter marinus TaxID=1121252 RepID=UPI00041C06E8|nr:hypothetical protein [Cucumibacter marinus]
MDYVNYVLLWAHFVGLGMGVGAGMSGGVLGGFIASASDETRPKFWEIQAGISRLSKIGLVLLIVTGIILVFTKFGGIGEMPWAFWVKMVLVVVMLVLVGLAESAGKKARKGDKQAAGQLKRYGPATGVVSFLVILSAVVAFN